MLCPFFGEFEESFVETRMASCAPRRNRWRLIKDRDSAKDDDEMQRRIDPLHKCCLPPGRLANIGFIPDQRVYTPITKDISVLPSFMYTDAEMQRREAARARNVCFLPYQGSATAGELRPDQGGNASAEEVFIKSANGDESVFNSPATAALNVNAANFIHDHVAVCSLSLLDLV